MKRNTVQRALTREAVAALHCHATAEQVYAQVAKAHPSVSRATVYRNLGELAADGEILRVAVPDGADRFDHNTVPHYHARCERCGRVFDVDMAYLGDLTGRIRDSQGFLFCGYDLIFRGVCQECRSDTGEKESLNNG